MDRLVTVAPKGTPCGWTAYGETGARLTCEGGKDAIHILTMTLPVAAEGTALCASHSPWDPTDAEREAVGQPAMTMGEAGALRLADEADAEQSGMDVLRELVTLEPVVSTQADQVVKFHKLSTPMIGILTEVATSRGLVGAWAMKNVIIRDVKGATIRTLKALIKRGMIEDVTNDGDQSGTGGLRDYVLTDAGFDVCDALGISLAELPDSAHDAAILAAKHTRASCETGCERLTARGAALLPAGGDVCLGCGSVFTRPSGQENPAIYVVASAVIVRNANAEGARNGW